MQVDFHEFTGLGTTWKIYVSDSLPDGAKEEVYSSVESMVLTFDNDYSRFKDKSLIGQLNKSGSLKDPPDELVKMLNYALDCAQITDGYFNIAAGTRMEDIGYDKNYSLKKNTFRPVQSLENILGVSAGVVELDETASIDLGGLGKGWLIDNIARELKSRGIKSFVIDGGGDILVRGRSLGEGAIPLENPFKDGQIIGEIQISNGAVASSSPKRRTWPDIKDGGELHHLVNPKSENTITSVSAVYTYANSATAADTASTCLFVSPSSLRDKIAKHFGVSYCIVNPDGRFYATADYPGKIYTKSQIPLA
jgi:thiamine biosynthesis lipoprotein